MKPRLDCASSRIVDSKLHRMKRPEDMNLQFLKELLKPFQDDAFPSSGFNKFKRVQDCKILQSLNINKDAWWAMGGTMKFSMSTYCVFKQQIKLHSQKKLVVLQALGSGPPNYRGDGPPLRGHQLRQVKQLLLFLAGPFCLLDAGVKPLVPGTHQHNNLTSRLTLTTQIYISICICTCITLTTQRRYFIQIYKRLELHILSCIRSIINIKNAIWLHLHSKHEIQSSSDTGDHGK